jgi:cytochrome c553
MDRRSSGIYDSFDALETEVMRIAIFVLFVAYCLALKVPTAAAAGDPDAATGLIAEKCTSCHEVPGYKARFERADLGAPAFETIAKNPDLYTPARLRAFLQKPHWPMTQFILSPSDIDNILAFIERLR